MKKTHRNLYFMYTLHFTGLRQHIFTYRFGSSNAKHKNNKNTEKPESSLRISIRLQKVTFLLLFLHSTFCLLSFDFLNLTVRGFAIQSFYYSYLFFWFFTVKLVSLFIETHFFKLPGYF